MHKYEMARRSEGKASNSLGVERKENERHEVKVSADHFKFIIHLFVPNMVPKKDYLRQLVGDEVKKVQYILDYSSPHRLCNNQITLRTMRFELSLSGPSVHGIFMMNYFRHCKEYVKQSETRMNIHEVTTLDLKIFHLFPSKIMFPFLPTPRSAEF